MPPVKNHCNQVERILSLEINQKSMAENLTEIKADVKEINLKFDTLMEKLDEKYSAKWVEVAIKRAGGIII